jgi:hypothetical protein
LLCILPVLLFNVPLKVELMDRFTSRHRTSF